MHADRHTYISICIHTCREIEGEREREKVDVNNRWMHIHICIHKILVYMDIWMSGDI